jgi:ElaB/YqjD/DUF883 family membrane-anchored ribosome-binding protein
MNVSTTPVPKSVSTADNLGQQIEALRADLTKLAATLAGDVSEGVGKAGRQISQTGRDARATATGTVLDHPLAAVGIAAGIGLLLGLVLRRT